ncbi:uroporphyrinogen-III synthase [Alteribacter aurantiacus]|uniref:uroporphyrinogen-III synthase n=1 Tax=Alteribacter aurantiacus TaxID=254410 RepID=UPI0003FC5E06|nr:uroporphyrinogen-III synthase [Alteribacter aurantiacus]
MTGAPSLEGLTIANTRAAHQAASFSKQIKAFGGVPVETPLIRVDPAGTSSELGTCLTNLGQYDTIVFTSANAILHTLDIMKSLGIEWSLLNEKTIACVGKKTKALLEEKGITTHIVPNTYDGDHLADALVASLPRGCRVLFPKSSLARDVIEKTLGQAGIHIDAPIAYYTNPEETEVNKLWSLVKEGQVDVITFLSPSTVNAFFSQEVQKEVPVTIGAIGPITEKALTSFGVNHAIVPAEYTTEALLWAIQRNI